jgi:hypothetical protein
MHQMLAETYVGLRAKRPATSDFNQNWKRQTNFIKTSQFQNLMKIRQAFIELSHADKKDGQT